MENTQTETTTQEQTTQAPPPVTDKATVNPGNEAKATAPASTETKTETPQTDNKTRGKQEFFKREEKREQKLSEQLAQRLSALEAELKAVREGKAAEAAKPAEPPSFLDDPDAALKAAREGATKDALEAFERKQAEAAEKAAYLQKAEGAEKWLLTRSHLKQDPALEKDLVGILQEDRFREIGRVDPQAAAELAYIQLCRAKGIAPDMDLVSGNSNQAAKGTTSAGVRPSAPGAGKRVFQKGEGHAYIMAAKPGTAEFERRLAEVTEAEAEGRVKR